MNIMLNGAEREIQDGATVADVVRRVTELRTGLAVAVNETVVPRAEWDTTEVRAADRLEVLTAVQGG